MNLNLEQIHKKHPGLVYKISFLFAFVAVFTFLALRLPNNSEAASLANFKPGNIISDYTMSNYESMTVEEIDQFLHNHGNCNNTETYKAAWYPSVHYHIKDGHFVCLADEVFAEGVEYGDLIPEGTKSRTAAQVIYDTAHEFKINPQVLIVLLEKEQGLISDSWPNSLQYRSATGFGCPDTAPCNELYYGFVNQLDNAAYLFRTVLDGGWTNYPLGENYIYYNPNRACGGSTVNIENLATSSLYRYTPYQPNAAALAAGYGTVACGAYGNRNFYLFFMDWFGDPTLTAYEDLLSPRYFEISEDTDRINPFTSEVIDQLPAGLIRKFDSKVRLSNGELCLRTESSTASNTDACIRMSSLKEIAFTYEEVLENEREKIIIPNAKKITLNSGDEAMSFSEYTIRNFPYKTTFQGTTYYITEFDAEHNNSQYGIEEKNLVESYTEFDSPKEYILNQTVNRINPFTGEVYDALQKDRKIKFASEITINNTTYYRTENNTINNINAGISKEYLSEVIAPEISYENFISPRQMVLTRTVDRINPFTKEIYDTLQKGRIIKFSTKIFIDGEWYFRTEINTRDGIDAVIPSNAIGEIRQ